ncbi:transposase [Metarhizium guizhouense ARSEF 977]|uniref:Transposase n=1 Tax=Metarhizium guizhouense (strain ARSEF 977) TaxID=1276136 RepID=A0A0B4HR20_METGA|nr:transposase [Metarhizium guizhouense ARSEF 977]
MHSDRQASEDLERVNVYFQRLFTILTEEGIPPEDIWNMDETGFSIGIGKDQLIVTKRKRAHYFGLPENRESATAIESISTGGRVIPAFLILSGQMHMAKWYGVPGLDDNAAIRPTPNGYSNDEISLEWLGMVTVPTTPSSLSSTVVITISSLLAVLEILAARQPESTPSPPSAGLQSSPFGTPVTLRQMNKVADKVTRVIKEDDNLDPDLRYEMSRFIRGSLALATELIQMKTKRDLGRTQMAEHLAQQRKALKNTPIQSGVVLTVAQGREMVRQREEDQLAKARKTVEAAELKAVNARKRVFEEAAKKARKWRVSERLDRAEVVDSEGGRRLLKRF